MSHVNNYQRGFTIAEMMLAMTFISVLLLAIALSIIQIGTIYNKGMTLREVNQAGRTVSDGVKRDFSASQVVSMTTDYLTTSAGGRLCLGTYSYIWNTEQALLANDVTVTAYETGQTPVRLVKVPDPSKAYCARSNGAFVYRTIRAIDQTKAVELLKPGDRTLSIHQLTVTSNAAVTDQASGQQLYELSFVIGTGDVNALTADRRQCKDPGSAGADFNYCAVQEFTIVIRVGNGVN